MLKLTEKLKEYTETLFSPDMLPKLDNIPTGKNVEKQALSHIVMGVYIFQPQRTAVEQYPLTFTFLQYLIQKFIF